MKFFVQVICVKRSQKIKEMGCSDPMNGDSIVTNKTQTNMLAKQRRVGKVGRTEKDVWATWLEVECLWKHIRLKALIIILLGMQHFHRMV